MTPVPCPLWASLSPVQHEGADEALPADGILAEPQVFDNKKGQEAAGT